MSWFGVWADSPVQAQALVEQLSAERPRAMTLLWHDDGRLAIAQFAEVHQHQRFSAEFSDVFVAGEARLDNRAELLAALDGEAHTSTDELLARAWSRWGARSGQHLLGDFALCAWHVPSRTLSLLRDPIGVKPLYYTTHDQALVWASEFGTLTKLSGLSRELDARMVVDYLGELPEDDSRTLLSAVRRLPPATWLTKSASKSPRVASYFSFAPRTPHLPSDVAYAEALLELLSQATAARVSVNGRTAVMLSGGLDSSMITVLASRTPSVARQGGILSVSATFDGFPGCNERPFQQAVVAALRTDHEEFNPTSRDASGNLTELFDTFGQPRPIGAHWLAWAAVTRAAARGAQVLLTGIDGDRVVSHGEGQLTEPARAHDYARLLQECWGYTHRSALGRMRLFAYQAAVGLVPLPWLHWLDDQRSARAPEVRALRRFLRPAPFNDAGALARLQSQSRRPASPGEAHQRRMAATDRSADLELLAALEPRFGVQLAHPFYDRRVIEFCLGLPSAQRKRGNQGRFVLRGAMRGLVPDAVRLRQDKAYFDAPFRAWARDWLARQDSNALIPRRTPLEGFVQIEDLRREIGAILAGRENGPALDFLWRTVILSRWFEGLGRGTRTP